MATRPRDRLARIIDAGLRLAAERGWRNVTLDDIAETAGLSIGEVYRLTPTKSAVLDAHARQVDLQVAPDGGATAAAGDESVHDRLFDVIMRRFDALAANKEAVRAIARDLPTDPRQALAATPQAARSLRWMLRAAGIETGGVRGAAIVKLMGFVWLASLRVWLDDDDPDLARTMAAVDRNLRRVAGWGGAFGGAREPEA